VYVSTNMHYAPSLTYTHTHTYILTHTHTHTHTDASADSISEMVDIYHEYGETVLVLGSR
jgi:hypothetical protein